MDTPRKNVKVTETVFNTVKFMVKGGATAMQCKEACGISTATITYIKRAETYEEYKALMLANSGGHIAKLKREEEERKAKDDKPTKTVTEELTVAPKPTVVEHVNTVTLVANQYMAEALKKQTELLTLINNKLTLIAEDLGCFRDEKIPNEGRA